MLTADGAVAHILDVGVVYWRGFLERERLDALRTAGDQLLACAHAETQSRSLRVWNLFAFDTVFRELLLDDRLRAVCTALLGDGHLLSDYSINAVHPGAAKDPWHVDYPYNEMPERVTSEAPLGLQCILALDHFDAANGATQLVPRSHGRSLPGAAITPEQVERFRAEPGDLLIMHAGTWHRAGLNTSPCTRVGIVFSFVQRWVRPIVAPRDVAAVLDVDLTEEIRVLLGAVVFETIDSRVVRREVV